jgi:hypothetical protein
MNPLARKTAASVLAAALVVGSFPRGAFAGDPAAPVAAAAAPTGPRSTVNAASALAQMQTWGVFKGDGDVLKTYLGDANHLTPLGEALYLSLVKTHDPALDKAAIADEVAGLQPALDRLRKNGPYSAQSAEAVNRTIAAFNQKFGAVDAAADGSPEGDYQRGTLREALMNGAAVSTPPKQSDMVQVQTKDGFEFWDANGLAYRINKGDANGKNAATTYNRALQQAQHAMNQNRPPEVSFIPETGRYNTEMFDYSYYRLKDQYDALVEGMRRDRVIALAELLGVSNKYRDDMWFNDKRIQADLEAEARTKVYGHHGQEYNVLELVNAKFKQRQYYLDGALKGVNRFKTDRDALAAELKGNAVVSDAQVQNLSLDEQYTLRYLSLGVLETQSFYVKNQMDRLDPSSPDAEQVMKAIDKSSLSPEEKAKYKMRAQDMVNRLQALNNILEKTRSTLSASDYAASLDLANAALTSSQRELGLIGADYSMFVEVPTVAFLGKEQGDVSWMNFGAKFTRWAYRTVRPNSDYTAAIRGINATQPQLINVARMIANGQTVQARQALIAMNPDAAKTSFTAALGGDSPKMTDALRLAASLKANRDRIGDVAETNKWLDATGTFITWTVDMAIAAPVLRSSFNGIGQWLGRYTGEAAAGEVSGLSRVALVRRPAIILRETLLHTAARLESLEPDAVWINGKASNVVTRTMLATTMRAGSVAMRQAAFTGMSAGISGTFTLGQHLWDVGSEKVFAPGESLTVSVATHSVFGLFTVGGDSYGIRPSDSMFSSDASGALDAFWTGAKGGTWWANTMMDVGGVPLLHPGMLGYVGLPSTAFRDTSLMRYAELVGSRGVVGSAVTGGKWLLGGGEAAAVAEGAARRGFLERLATAGEAGSWQRAAGYATSFSLGMADNVAKYALFSDAVGWAGKEYAYNWGKSSDQDDVERRIKGSNAEGQKWLASPAWMLIPTYAAHPARDAAIYMRGAQGAEQYKAAGLDHEIANAEEGARLRFLKTPEVPISQRIFEASLKSRETGDYFIVSKEMRREAIKSQMVTSLGGEKATPADINPLEFYRATKMADGENFVNLKVNDEVRLVAHQDFVEALLADPVRAGKVLNAVPGTVVEGFGEVMPDVQKDVAVALYSAEMQVGKPMPKELAARVNEILKPYLDANLSVKPFAEGLIKALDGSPQASEAFGATDAKQPGWALQDVMSRVTEWKAKPDRPYTELISDLRKQADSDMNVGKTGPDGKTLKLTAAEHDVLIKLYDYLDSIESRFNAFNTVAKASELANASLKALKLKYAGHPAVVKTLGGFSDALTAWSREHGPTDVVDGPRSDGTFKKMMGTLAKNLEDSKASLTPSELAAMKEALSDVGASPWVLHDSKGSALPGWRPEQFESLMGAMTAILQQGRGGSSVRLFQMLKTGGGKTMLTFEGLLPLVEADAGNRDMQPIFLTVQSNLEAQGRMEFIAYKKIGSNLKFDTYEGFKTKIAEGKTKGKNAMDDYWILGDEMDGAALQPALTIGQVSGGVTKRNPIYNRVDELDTGLANRLSSDQTSRDTRVQTEARRTQNALARITGPSSDEVVAAGVRLENATGRLREAKGPEARRAALADIQTGVARLQKLLDAVPSRSADAVQTARQSLGRLNEALTAPAGDAASRVSAVKDLETGFTREENLLRQTPIDVERGRVEAESQGAKLENRIDQLTEDIANMRKSNKPGSAERADALTAEQAILKNELAIVDRFRTEDAGTRLANLQEKIASAEFDPSSVSPEKLADWRKQAGDFQAALPPEARAVAQSHAEALGRVNDAGRQIGELDVQIAEAEREGRSADDLKTRRAALGNDYKTDRAEAARLKDQLASGYGGADLGSMIKRYNALTAEGDKLEGRIDKASRQKNTKEDVPSMTRRLEAIRSEQQPLVDGLRRRLDVTAGSADHASQRAQVLELIQGELRRRMSASADDIVATVRDGKPGWVDEATRLLERRRSMMEAFGGGENPMYTAFRDMRDDMQGFAMNEQLRSSDPAVYKPAAERLMRMVNGKGLLSNLSPWQRVPTDETKTTPAKDRTPENTRYETRFGTPPLIKLLSEVFRGRDVDVPVDQVGLTRVHAAKLLKAMLADPTLPPHQRDNMFWSLSSSLLWPGSKGKSSWVRTELLRQLHGFYDDPAGIRMDSRTGRINVVHNGQWFESMDNETRRYWELEYGVDLTLPYTNSSISTIKDITTNKKGRFISFSGTAGEKLREHFEENGIRIQGEGSRPPLDPDRVVVASLEGAPEGGRAAIEARLGRPFAEGDVLRLSDFSDPAQAATREWLEGKPRKVDVDMNVVSGPADRMNRIGRALSDVTASRGRVVVESLEDAPQAVREQIERKLGGPLLEPRTLKLTDFADPKLAEARDWLTGLREREGDADRVVLLKSDAIPEDVRPAIDAYLAKNKLAGKDERVVRISDVTGADDAQTAAAQKWLREARAAQADSVMLRASDSMPAGVKPVVDAYLRSRGIRLGGSDEVSVNIGEVEAKGPDGRIDQARTDAARAWLRDVRPSHVDSSLVVLSVSDTRVLKVVKKYLAAQGIKDDEIAMVFSDTEYLRNNVPEAQVARQMNLGALDSGKARVLILDTRVGGRGLDLNFKGERGSLDPKAFRGYTSYEMLIVDPQKMSQVHLLQAEGRIDVGRVLPGAGRQFSLVMDIKSVVEERVFREMIAEDPLQLRSDPKFVDFEKTHGGKADWATIHDYVTARGADGTPDGALLAEQYQEMVKKYLEIVQGEVEENQLRGSSVMTDAPKKAGRFPGIEDMR